MWRDEETSSSQSLPAALAPFKVKMAPIGGVCQQSVQSFILFFSAQRPLCVAEQRTEDNVHVEALTAVSCSALTAPVCVTLPVKLKATVVCFVSSESLCTFPESGVAHKVHLDNH